MRMTLEQFRITRSVCKKLITLVILMLMVVIGLFTEHTSAASIFENIASYVEFDDEDIKGPFGLAIDAEGNIYVADGKNDRVVIFGDDGTELDHIPLGDPGTMTIKDQVLYVVGSTGDIYKFDLNNNYQQIGDKIYVNDNIYGLAVDSQGNIFANGNAYSRLYKITPNGDITIYLNYYDLGQEFGQSFSNSKGIAIDEDDTLYVISGHENIHRWDKHKNYLGVWKYDVNYERKGIAYYNGDLYVTLHEHWKRGFERISATDGRILGTFSEDKIAYQAFDIAVHPLTGRIYVLYQNHVEQSGMWVFKDKGTTTSLSVSPNEINYSEPVTISVSVSANDFESPEPTGTVTIKDGSTELAMLNLVNGQASDTVSSLLPGNRSITAVYSGDTNFPEDISMSAMVMVNKIPSLTTLQAASSKVEVGEKVEFTATVTGTGSISETPTGTVTFKDGDEVIGTETLGSNGTVTLDVSNLAFGEHTITATYSGDNIFLVSTATLQLTVEKASTVMKVVASPAASVYGESVTFTATVTALNPANASPTGMVTFRNGTQELDTVPLTDGEAALQVSDLNVGSHMISAVYHGDSQFNTSNDTVQQIVSQANTTTHVTTSLEESVFGEEVTFTATVTVKTPGGGTPTGTVTFMNGGTELGSVILNNGTASLAVSNLAVGAHTITAEYSGDNSFATSSSDNVAQTVNQASTTTQVTSSEASSTYGESITFTVTVTANAPGSGTPSGIVTFMSGAEELSQATLDGDGTATLSGINHLPVGQHTITASYGGDSSFLPSNGTVQQSVDKANTTMNLTTSLATITVGDNVTFTANVTAAGSANETPTGTVTFMNGTEELGKVSLDASGTAVLNVSSLIVGDHTIVAKYSGDGLFESSSGTVSQTVDKAQTSINMATSAEPSVFGQEVAFIATVTALNPDLGTPTGNVIFKNDGVEIDQVPLSAGTAMIEVDTLAVGQHTITAEYAGDHSFSLSSSTLKQQVNSSETKTTVTTSPSPSVFGQKVTFSATVTAVAPGAGLPSGNVNFSSGGSLLGSVTLVDGSASIEVSDLAVDDYTISAEYSGEHSFLASSGMVEQTVSKANTTTNVTTSNGESVFGEDVTFTVTVTANAPGSGTPSGTVTFKNGAEELGQATLDSSGSASLNGINHLPVGQHTISAEYSGDQSFLGSSGTVQQTVVKAHTVIDVTTSKSTSVYGEDVTFTVMVRAVGSASETPSGTVTLMNGTEELGQATLDGSGVASLHVSNLTVGTHTLTAKYSGDHVFSANSATVQQTVNKADTLTSAVTSKGTSVFGEKVMLTATVTADGSGSGTPTGTVTFKHGVEELGVETLVDGVATLETNTLLVGEYTIWVEYNGDSSFLTSSDTIDQKVNKGASRTSMAQTVSASVYGENITFTAIVNPVAQSSGTPSGVVRFFSDAEELGTVTLSGGIATLNGINHLSVGEYTITAEYSGDSSFMASIGSAEQKVNRASTTTSVTKSVYGDEVTFMATVMVHSPGSGTPSGMVKFMNVAEELGEVMLNGGTASLVVKGMLPGEHTITAVYSGDSSFLPSSGTVGQTVNRAGSTTSVTTSKSTSAYGENITFTATVHAVDRIALAPTGTISFMLGSQPLGTAVLLGDTATLETNALEVGTHTLTAEYSGDSIFLPSSGAVLQTVNRPSSDSSTEPSSPSGSSGSTQPWQPLQPEPVVSTEGELIVPPGGSGAVSLGESISVTLPEGLSDEEVRLTIEELVENAEFISNQGELLSGVYEILSNLTGIFDKEITITIVFDPTKLAQGQTASIFYFDEAKREWVEIGGVVEGNRISVTVDHLTKFAVFAVNNLEVPQSEEEPSITLSDISGHWAEAIIVQATASGLVNGYPDGTFRPNRPVTRAEFTVMLINGLKLDVHPAELIFTDRHQIGDWAVEAISQAVQLGIIHGYEDGSFKPNDHINRTEMVVMIANVLNTGKDALIETGFSDDKDIPAWAKGSVEAVRQLGIVSGRGEDKFAPDEKATRAEAMTIILNMLAQIK